MAEIFFLRSFRISQIVTSFEVTKLKKKCIRLI